MPPPSANPVRPHRTSLKNWFRKTFVSPLLFLGLVTLISGAFGGSWGFTLARRASHGVREDGTQRSELQSDLEGTVGAASLLQSVKLNAQFRTILMRPQKHGKLTEAKKSSRSQKLSIETDEDRGELLGTGAAAESGLRVQVIEGGLKGSLHEEPGFVRWRDSVILLGSFNVSRDYAPVLSATHHELLAIGSTRTTIYNLTTGDVTIGPDFPVLMHHPAAAISPGGVVHLVGSADWSDMSSPNNDAFHFTWDVEGGATDWIDRARVLGAAGGFSCEFLGEFMYCCGGGRRLQERTGDLLRVYNPANDSWSEAAPLPEPADHVTLLVYEGELWGVGGASSFNPRYGAYNPKFTSHDHYRHSITQLAVYNPSTNQWLVKQPLPYSRAAPIVALVQRPGKRASMLMGGGEVYLGSNGMAVTSLSEYDFGEDVWFCHVDPLPFPVFGAGSALWNDRWYILGGGESYNLAATDRVMIVDVANLPTPEPCAGQQGRQEKTWWQTRAASWQKTFPYPKQFLEKR
ncbi:hypothetical protein KFL_002180110 [Klebsormidium nitens]|uniref:Kelch repeat-containing protein n=1 Tax=Klebsormidium nitens TaxID=105231 RepID=A0A1Y1I8L8_KLENI|nr:hypothetical protein KFL_002180110 [Klebsormidium nitens]|eukprot:GAQ85036.1 hypothetical protein KFL_002180110 [Klebsormidium nitens]